MIEIGPVIGYGKMEDKERKRETFEGDGYVHYLDWGDDFTNTYIYQNLPNCI